MENNSWVFSIMIHSPRRALTVCLEIAFFSLASSFTWKTVWSSGYGAFQASKYMLRSSEQALSKSAIFPDISSFGSFPDMRHLRYFSTIPVMVSNCSFTSAAFPSNTEKASLLPVLFECSLIQSPNSVPSPKQQKPLWTNFCFWPFSYLGFGVKTQ